jgi:PEGA domain
MKRLYAVAAAAAFTIALTGCATVINGTSQDYQIDSMPSGAKATLSSGETCTTPCEISLKRRNDLSVAFELAGYKSETVMVQSRTGGAGVGNILLGGVIGAGVDAANGSMNSLYPRPLRIKLAADGSSEEATLLDKKDETIGTVTAHNEKVRADVEEGIAKQKAKAEKKAASAK